MPEEKVGCRTPAEGRDGVTNIPAWKYDVMRSAIVSALAGGPLDLSDLRDAVREKTSADDKARLGSLTWHLTTVKLEMEVRGELERVAGVRPQQIQLRSEVA